MDSNWADARTQLDQVLASERALRQARHRQQPTVRQRLRQWWAPLLCWIAMVFAGI